MMTKYKSLALIEDLQQQTESFLQKAVSEWQITPVTRLLRQQGVNKWSAAQCVEHLNSYARYYLPEIEKAIEKGHQQNAGAVEQFKAGWLGDYFTKLMMPGKTMKKMSAPGNHVPPKNLDSPRVVIEFTEHQKKLLVLLETAKKINLEKIKVPVCIAKFIKLKLGDTFRFLVAHNHRHVLQAVRALDTEGAGEELKVAGLLQKS